MSKKILIIIPGIPYPPIDGHKLKIFNLIKILSKFYDLHLITISRKSLAADEKLFIDSHSYKNAHFKITFSGIFIRLFKNLFSKIPFQVSYFTLNKIKKYLRTETVNDNYVFLNLVRTSGYLTDLGEKKKIFDIVDVLSKSYYKSYLTTTSKLFKFIYKIEYGRLENQELDVVKAVDLTLFVNKDEAVSLSLEGNVKWLPNGVNEKLFENIDVDTAHANNIAFFGAMFYQPNIDAVLWMDKYILDFIDDKINLIIIGSRPSKEILNLAKKRKNVKVTGFLENPYTILNSCFAIVSPMQNGGGIQNKILETMAMGKINIITSYGADPIIGGINGKHFLVEDSPEKMRALINDVFYNKPNYDYIGKNAKKLIQDSYTWQSYENKLIDELEKL